MKNMQLTLSDESIDAFIKKLENLKKMNNMVIRIGGENGPELLIVHEKFKVPEVKDADNNTEQEGV